MLLCVLRLLGSRLLLLLCSELPLCDELLTLLAVLLELLLCELLLCELVHGQDITEPAGVTVIVAGMLPQKAEVWCANVFGPNGSNVPISQ